MALLKIAVVGAGVSGLVAAHRLAADGHAVTVLEADPLRAGGHAHTIDVRGEPVDVGFLVLNDRNYPGFEALLAELGVATRASDMSFSVSDGRDFEYAGNGPRGLFANPRHLLDRRFLTMVNEYRRFNADAQALLASDQDPSLREWLERCGYSRLFIDGLLVPQAAAVWSTHPGQMWTFPAKFLVRFFDNHGMLSFRDRPQWRTVVGGSRAYVDAIAARLGPDRLRLGAAVTRVARTDDGGVDVSVAGAGTERYDEVVLACHSDQALALLDAPTAAEREVLGAIPYLGSELALHEDTSLLPRRRAAWASWNSHLVENPPPVPTVSYWVSNLQGHANRDLVVSLNRTADVAPDRLHATVDVAHPTYTPEGLRAQERWAEISGADRLHFAGAYWAWGFHEDGLQSGLRVASALAERAEAVPA